MGAVLLQALANFADPQVMIAIVATAFYGLIIGAIPGLTATLAAALLVPFAFFLSPLPAIAAFATASALAIFAGDIPAALVRVPGTPATAAYTDDSYLLTQKGKVGLVFGVDILSSAMGGIVGAFALIFIASFLAKVAQNFTTFEFFWFAVLGLSTSVMLSAASPVKAFISLLIGLLLGTIGLDVTLGFPRFTFGNPNLLGGISFIPAMTGLFGVAEVLRNVVSMAREEEFIQKVAFTTKGMFREAIKVFSKFKVNMIRSNIIGIVIGALPGAGADIAAWVANGVAKRFSKHPEKYGTGYIEPIVDAGFANNSALAATWIPALVFGIPGDSITAILIGVLMMKGLRPGPLIFQQQAPLLYSIYITFIIANLLMIPIGWIAVKISSQLLRIPKKILMPLILLMCMLGSYAINNNPFDIGVMLGMGLLGFLLEANGFPVAPVVLGLVVGPIVEWNFMQSFIKTQGNLLPFITRPISLGMALFVLLLWGYPLLRKLLWVILRNRAQDGKT